MSDEKTKGYRDTLNLPKTDFAMKANLVQREPQLRKEWAKKDIYAQIRTARRGADRADRGAREPRRARPGADVGPA